MNNSMIIGRYFQKDSLIHRLDPRTKLISLILLMVSLFIIPCSSALLIILYAVLVFIEPPTLRPSNLTKISALSGSAILLRRIMGVLPIASKILLQIIN